MEIIIKTNKYLEKSLENFSNGWQEREGDELKLKHQRLSPQALVKLSSQTKLLNTLLNKHKTPLNLFLKLT